MKNIKKCFGWVLALVALVVLSGCSGVGGGHSSADAALYEPMEGDYFKTELGTIHLDGIPKDIVIVDGHLHVTVAGFSNVDGVLTAREFVSVIRPSDWKIVDEIAPPAYDSNKVVTVGEVSYVVNSSADSVLAVGTWNNAVIDTIPVGDNPVAIAAKDWRLLVVNRNDNSLSVVSLLDGMATKTIENVGNVPWNIIVVDGRVLVVSFLGDSVLEVDPLKGVVVESIAVGDGPTDIVEANGYVFVANRNENSFSVISVPEMKVIDTIPVGKNPTDLAVWRGRLYVLNSGDKSMTVYGY